LRGGGGSLDLVEGRVIAYELAVDDSRLPRVDVARWKAKKVSAPFARDLLTLPSSSASLHSSLAR